MTGPRTHIQTPSPSRTGGSARPVPRAYHASIPGYRVTDLVSLPEMAERVGVAEVLVKDECERFGLPSFKILGGSWAVHRLLCRLAGAAPDESDFSELRTIAERLRPLTLITATDGNHGRGVARMARLLGLAAVVMVPDDMVEPRRDAIASEGAEVIVIDGDYDQAVRAAADMAASRVDAHLVADVALTPEDEVPAWVMEGYYTIFDEVAEQATQPPTVLFIQAGVGALAAAALGYYEVEVPELRTAVVEPLTAACLLESAIAGEPISLAESQGSMMAGLNCGTPSSVAWPVIEARTAAFLALDDDLAAEAMRILARARVVAGESGAAGLAGLLVAAEDPTTRRALGLDERSRVLLVNTEGATDPDNFRRIVGDIADELPGATS